MSIRIQPLPFFIVSGALCLFGGPGLAARPYSESLGNAKDFVRIEVPAFKLVPFKIALPPGHKFNRDAKSWLALFDFRRVPVKEWNQRALQGTPNFPRLKLQQIYYLQGMIYHCSQKIVSACENRVVQATVWPGPSEVSGPVTPLTIDIN